MNISKIVKMKSNKYKICIDGEDIITYDNVILDNGLLFKKTIDKSLYNKILLDTNFYNAYDKTVKYILKKRRSEKEVLEYLSKFNLSNDNVSSIINKLKSLNFINDVEYCKAYINDKIYLSKNGINKIRVDLLEQNIPIEIIDRELSNIDNTIIDDRLERLIIKKIKANHNNSNRHLKQKILNEMINLGYSKDKALELIDKNIESDDEIVKKQFEKIYNSLSRKYSGEELNIKIKQKLIYKGFDISIIDELIKKM